MKTYLCGCTEELPCAEHAKLEETEARFMDDLAALQSDFHLPLEHEALQSLSEAKDSKAAAQVEIHSGPFGTGNSAALGILNRIDLETDRLLEVLMLEGPGPLLAPGSELKILRGDRGSARAGVAPARFVRDQAMSELINAATALRKAIT